ncbi:MAG: ribosome silencing factor [Lachnospiraceae bacterium]|nr:ribosome silencing factor [Lachnospiraceae bacterium]
MAESYTDRLKDTVTALAGRLDEKKANDIRVLDISKVSVMADYFLITSGNNKNHIQMLSDETDRFLSSKGLQLKQIEGYDSAGWILLDFGDVIVHIFDKENRLFYDLERIWKDGTPLTI